MSTVRDPYWTARLIAAFILTPALPVLAIAVPALLRGFREFAGLVLLFGGAAAAIIVLLVVMPLYRWLKRNDRLRLSWAPVAGGAAMAAFIFLVDLGWVLSHFGGGTGISAGVTMVENGFPTPFGALLLFILWPAAAFAVGAPLGLIGWFIAFGFRNRPPMPSAAVTAGEPARSSQPEA